MERNPQILHFKTKESGGKRGGGGEGRETTLEDTEKA